MKLQVLRFSSEPDSTSGILMDVTDPYNKKFLAYTIEDEHRDEKIRGETRIPAGTYPVVLREEGGFSARYLKSYGSDFHPFLLLSSPYSSGSNYMTTYPHIRDALLKGEKVTIQYVDYDTKANPFTVFKRKATKPERKVTKVYEPRKGWWN
jgi:hypothetical protein